MISWVLGANSAIGIRAMTQSQELSVKLPLTRLGSEHAARSSAQAGSAQPEVVPAPTREGSCDLRTEPFRRHVRDVEMRVYEGAPHNICDAFPERCAGDVLDFLGRRFGLGA